MDEAELARRRIQMGRTCQPWAELSGARGVGEVGAGHWIMLSGGSSPDVNMALVHDGEPRTLAAVKGKVEDAGYPTLMMLAGPSGEGELGGGWEHVGAMPFMASELTDEHLRADPRVRRAGREDFDSVGELLAEAFVLEREDADVCARILLADQDAASIWLLLQDGEPVSTVTTALVEDAVCVWCMATPTRVGRRGYGRALLADVLLRSRQQGASLGLLGATPAGQPLYEATGWETLESWQLHVNVPPAH